MRQKEKIELDHLLKALCNEEMFKLIDLIHTSHLQSNSSQDGLIYLRSWLEKVENKVGENIDSIDS